MLFIALKRSHYVTTVLSTSHVFARVRFFLNLWASSKQSAFKWVTPKGTDCLLHIQSISWVTLFNRDALFSCSCAGAPGLSRFLLNSESVNFVTQSFKMISQGSKIAAYIFCECHRKFYRVLCKSPKEELRLSLQGDTRSREGWGCTSPKCRCLY